MAGLSRIDGDLNVVGNLSASSVTFPALDIVNADISASAAIAASKTQTYITKIYVQDDGSDIVAAIAPIHLVRGAGAACCTILSVDVCCIDSPSGGNEGFTVDLQMAGVSVLGAVITYGAAGAQSDLDVLEGSVTDASHDHDDLLVVVVAALGATGAKGQGLHVEVRMTETYPV